MSLAFFPLAGLRPPRAIRRLGRRQRHLLGDARARRAVERAARLVVKRYSRANLNLVRPPGDAVRLRAERVRLHGEHAQAVPARLVRCGQPAGRGRDEPRELPRGETLPVVGAEGRTRSSPPPRMQPPCDPARPRTISAIASPCPSARDRKTRRIASRGRSPRASCRRERRLESSSRRSPSSTLVSSS